MEKKPAMCISDEEQTSIRALAGTLEETIELSQTLYNSVVDSVPSAEAVVVVASFDAEPPTRKALKAQPVPVFDEEPGSKG
jgi:hypothetical protein